MDTTQLSANAGRPSPPPSVLLQHLRSTAWTCATINASTCATYPPRLYVTTSKSQPRAKCLTQTLALPAERRLRDILQIKTADQVESVATHPALQLLDTVNPYMNAFDLWELTTLYQEVVGSTFWLLDFNALDLPGRIWPLPAQNVLIQPNPDADGFVYQYRGETYQEHQIIHFRYPDPANPYGYGMSPLRAVYNEARIAESYADLKIARFDNRAAPDIVLTPKEAISVDERDRLELQWNTKYKRGGNGKLLVAESDFGVELLNGQMGDIALLAEKGANSDDICNAFHVPLSMLSTNTNLANLQASEAQHASKCIAPRLKRRDQKLNEQLLPFYDPSHRLYFCSDDPRPKSEENDWRMIDTAAKYGIMTINELRAAQDMPPVPWGDKPCTPSSASPITPNAPANLSSNSGGATNSSGK